jgi:Polyketide cyclase / dehydrase and lipid transport
MLPLNATQAVTTHAPAEAVWRAFEAVKRWPKTMRSLREVSVEPPGPLRPGSLIRAVSESGASPHPPHPPAPPHRLVLVIDEADFYSRTEYEIAAGEDGTQITVRGTLAARGIGQWIRFLLWRERMTPMLRTTLRERAQGIADLAERMREQN